MTIWISRELPLLNFECLDILRTWVRPLSEKLWPFEFLERFCCLISSVSIYYAPESDLWVKSYDHLNCSRASIVQFRASRYIMRLNRTCEWNVMTIWISREHPLFNFDRLDILCTCIGPLSETLWPFELLETFCWSISSVSIYYAPESDLWVKSYDHLNCTRASIVQFRASRYIMRLNRISEWKVMTVWISRELPLLNFERLDIICAWLEPPSEKLWPFELLKGFHCSISSVSIYYAPESDLWVKSYDHLNFSRASVAQFRASRYIMRLNRISEWKVMTVWISREVPLSISSVSIYYAPDSNLWVKCYDHLNCSRASIVQFRASRYIMRLNRISEWKVMTIWISRELPLLNFEHLDILCAWLEPLSEKLWPFELLKSFHCSISSVSIYYAPESDLWVKSYDHLNFSRASVAQFRASRYIMRLTRTSEWKVMTIWIAQELPLFNFERLDILCTWIRSPSEKLSPFEFLESFHCSISSVSIYYAPKSDLQVKSYDHLNFSRASILQFQTSRYFMHLN